MVERRVLTPLVQVQILVPQPKFWRPQIRPGRAPITLQAIFHLSYCGLSFRPASHLLRKIRITGTSASRTAIVMNKAAQKPSQA